jgi:elongation factor P--beta-lysine ligase
MGEERGARKHLLVRARVLDDTRSFFASRGYMEVETPIAVPCPGLDVHLADFVAGPTMARAMPEPTAPAPPLLANGLHSIGPGRGCSH